MDFTIAEIADRFYAIDQNGVRAFLLVGRENAVLVDTCFGGDILSVCRSLTKNPITLITTHGDPDHMGCHHQFPAHYIHRAELPRYQSRSKGEMETLFMEEGDVFHVGAYALEVLWIPGHTPGSIALLDRTHRFLISGDTVQGGCIFMHGEGRDLKRFRESIGKLEQMRQAGLFDTVYPSHGEAVIPADVLEDHLALAEDVLGGRAVPAGPAPDWFPDTVKVFRHGRAQMYYPWE